MNTFLTLNQTQNILEYLQGFTLMPLFQALERLVDMASDLEGIDVKFFKATENLQLAFKSFQDGNKVDTNFFR